MRIPRPLRTSNFRFSVLYAGGFALSVVVLFCIVIVSASHFMTQQIDKTVESEMVEVQGDLAQADAGSAGQVVDGFAKKSPGILYLLQNAQREAIGGNMQAIRPVPGLRSLRQNHERPGQNFSGGIRGKGAILPNGNYLFIGLSDFQIREMQEAIARAFVLGLIVTTGLALICGIGTSARLLKRIEAISAASRAIMQGDLHERLPLHGTGDELDHLAGSLNTMLARIQDLMVNVQQVSNDIAHDLRTPLSRLRQRLETARRRGKSVEDLGDAVDGAIDQVDAILATFSALLRIAQIESGARRAAFAPVDLSATLRHLAEIYRVVADEAGHPFAHAIADGFFVLGDRDLLNQLFANLIENAITHTPPGTQIALTVQQQGNVLQVVVADTGLGIAPVFREKVLQRFFRMDASRSKPGNGLGLNMVAAIAALHNGRLALLDNEPGLRCVVHIPAIERG